jgi:hypothetical protein
LFQSTYLRFIEEEATAKRARAQIRPEDWSMSRKKKWEDAYPSPWSFAKNQSVE